MAKYRALTAEELEALEQEFIQYLVANGITADDWQRLKIDDKEAADRIVDLFSDVIMEGVLRKTAYVEYHSKQKVIAFYFEEADVTMVAMSSDHVDADFTDQQYIAYAAATPPSDLRIQRQTKAFVKTRSEEIWDLIAQGCTVSDGTLYRALDKASSE